MIYQLTYKTKQFFFVLIKISIVVLAFYFIYQKLTKSSHLEYSSFSELSSKNNIFSLKNIVFLTFISGFNWFFEIMKWQKLVSPIKNISFKTALEQTLGSLTASLFTPNRIGEYGAKAIHYTKEYQKRIMIINLISNILQMSVTCILGIIGLYFFVMEYQLVLNYANFFKISIAIIVLVALIVFIMCKTKVAFKQFYFEKIKTFLSNYPRKIISYGIGLSLLRYLIFSFQFYYLLMLFEIELSYLHAMILITCMYLLASVIPSIFIFDVIVKGSVAVYLFSFASVNSLIVLSIITLMWLFNFVIPSVFGSYFVLKFNLPEANS